MKIQLLKDHGNGYAGQILSVGAVTAARLISEGIAELLEAKEEKLVYKTKEKKTKNKTKSKTVIKSVNVPKEEDNAEESTD